MKHSIMMSAVLAPIVAACLFAASCTRSNEQAVSENKPPEVTVINFSSPDIRLGDSIVAMAQARDMEGDPIKYEYQWLVNGGPVDGAMDQAFPTDGLAPGDKISVKVRAVETNSNRAGEWKESKPISLKEPRSLQLRGVELEPKIIKADSTAEAAVDYGDLDPHDVDVVYYRWNVNGVDLPGEDNSAPTLAPGHLVHGDQVKVTVCLDGLFKSPNVWTSSLYLVADSAPVFTSSPDIGDEGGNIVVYFNVEDPDGDQLSYSISGAPPGSYVDRKNGTKLVVNTKATPGTYNIVISASDNLGGITGMSVTVTIPEQPQYS